MMKKVEIKNKVVARDGGTLGSPSKGAAASVDLSAYLLASVFAEAFEVQQTEDGERYVLAKLPMAVSGGITMFADGGVLDLPTIYDGIPVDGDTIYWEDVALPDGGTTRKLKAKGGQGGEGLGYTLKWAGYSEGEFDGSEEKTIEIPSLISQLENDAKFATEEWVGNDFLSLEGGTISGDLRLKGDEDYGNALYFGDFRNCYLKEVNDDFLVIYAKNGIDLQTGKNGFVTINGSAVGGGVSAALSWEGYSEGTYDGTSAMTIEIPDNTNQLTNGAGFLTSSALSGYATESWVNGKGFLTSSALSGYATESWVNGKGFLISSALSGYATESWVNGKGFLTSSALSGYATESWVDSNYLSIGGGTITGDLRLKGSGSYGNTIYFGDGSYCYFKEDTDNHMYMYSSKGFDAKVGSSYYFGIEGKGVKVNGGILTYNASSGYWELDGDLLVKGQITMEG